MEIIQYNIQHLIIVNSKIIFILYLLTFNIIINDIGAILSNINNIEEIKYKGELRKIQNEKKERNQQYMQNLEMKK